MLFKANKLSVNINNNKCVLFNINNKNTISNFKDTHIKHCNSN